MADVPTKTTTASPSALQYLDKAVGSLRKLGLMPAKSGDPAPIVALLNQISDLQPDKVAAIARTLDQASVFNDVVRENVAAITVGERYKGVTDAFNSIRDDAKALVDQYADGKISTFERMQNSWMKMTRGDIASRFGKIKSLYLEVQKETKLQIEKETLILEAYMDFRGAMKQSEVLALDVLKTAEGKLEDARKAMTAASEAVTAYAGTDPAPRAELELKRDEQLRALQAEEKRYQVAKDLSDNITVGYNTSEVIMARLVQTTNAKERIYAQSVSFFGTNEVVLTALTASFTGMQGLAESTMTLDAMKKGVDQSLIVSVRHRRQGSGSGAEIRLWPDHLRRCRQDAGRFRRQLSGTLARHHLRDAPAGDAEQPGNPRRGRGWQEAPDAPD